MKRKQIFVLRLKRGRFTHRVGGRGLSLHTTWPSPLERHASGAGNQWDGPPYPLVPRVGIYVNCSLCHVCDLPHDFPALSLPPIFPLVADLDILALPSHFTPAPHMMFLRVTDHPIIQACYHSAACIAHPWYPPPPLALKQTLQSYGNNSCCSNCISPSAKRLKVQSNSLTTSK